MTVMDKTLNPTCKCCGHYYPVETSIHPDYCDECFIKQDNIKKCSHKNIDRWNHGYHSECLDCGAVDV